MASSDLVLMLVAALGSAAVGLAILHLASKIPAETKRKPRGRYTLRRGVRIGRWPPHDVRG
jgi:hypothetical protein